MPIPFILVQQMIEITCFILAQYALIKTQSFSRARPAGALRLNGFWISLRAGGVCKLEVSSRFFEYPKSRPIRPIRNTSSAFPERER